MMFSIPPANASAQTSTQTLAALIDEARTAQSRGDYSQAAEAYRNALVLEPNVAELSANLGLMDYESGNHSEAIKSFQHAALLKPSLFVPQLFLGLEDLDANKAGAALPWLRNAVKLNPDDLQAVLSLARAYQMLDQPDRAASFYLRATVLAPHNAKAWLQLGTAYLEQVDNDARTMTSEYSNSAYVKLRAGETYADEGKLGRAQEEFEAALKTPPPPPCAYTELGVVLLREGRGNEARKLFDKQTRVALPCSLTQLGIAVADIAQGNGTFALRELASAEKADPGFVGSSLSLFRGAVRPEQAKAFIDLARSQRLPDATLQNIPSIVERAFLSGDSPVTASSNEEGDKTPLNHRSTDSAGRLYSSGHFAQCDKMLKPALDNLGPAQLELLASCSFSTGDFRTASAVGERLRSRPIDKAQGLYWEGKADQRLAVEALAQASEIDPDLPGLHVLLGNADRQQRRWNDAEGEYRKALALEPNSRAARLSLGIVLFTELKNDEALEVDKALLAKTPDDPEANLLAAEILELEHRFKDAEPYLTKCADLPPELLPQVHILAGRAYAETNRIPDAIAEYKLAIRTDQDGTLHYQLARLYRKRGDDAAAEKQMRMSKQIREKWDNQAHPDLNQPLSDTTIK